MPGALPCCMRPGVAARLPQSALLHTRAHARIATYAARGRGSSNGGRSPSSGGGSWQEGTWHPGSSTGGPRDGVDNNVAPQAASSSGGSGSPSGPGSSRTSPQPTGFLQSFPGMRRDNDGAGSGSSSGGNLTSPIGASLAARLKAGATGGGGGYGSSTGWSNGGWGSSSGAGAGGRGAGDSWAFRPTEHADGAHVALWTIAALAPVAVWCLTWSLTTGLAHLADASMGGMCGVARALFPTLPLKGVAHEDVAVSLVKSMQAGTADDTTWTRPGLFLPGWIMQGLMRLFLGLAVASTSIAASLGQTGPWMSACGTSQALIYALALLIALPVGAGLHSLMQRVERALGGSGDTGDSAAAGSKGSSPTPGSNSSSSTALTLKLAATLAWPCISASAVTGAIAARALASPPLGLATLKVAAAATTVALSLTIALATARYAREIGLGTAGDTAATDFGLQVGLLCGAQAAVNLIQLGLGVVSGGLALREVGVALLSTVVLVRVAGTVWLLQGETRPSVWLQLLTLNTLLARNKPT